MSETLEKHIHRREGDNTMQRELSFFGERSEDEKNEVERWAAVILQLTEDVSNSTGFDEASDITSQLPRLINIPSAITTEALGQVVPNRDSISNPSHLPQAIAELVSVCQQSNNRLTETESLARRLEELTQTMLRMQQEHYAALSNGSSSPVFSSEMNASDSFRLLENPSPQRYDPPAIIRPFSNGTMAREAAPDPPEYDSYSEKPEESIPSKPNQTSEIKSLDFDFSESNKQDKKSGREKTATDAEFQKKTILPDDALVQAIVAELFKKQLKENDIQKLVAKEPANTVELLARDVQQKLTSKETTKPSNPTNWIEERLKPPPPASLQKQEKQLKKEASQKNWLRIPVDDPEDDWLVEYIKKNPSKVEDEKLQNKENELPNGTKACDGGLRVPMDERELIVKEEQEELEYWSRMQQDDPPERVDADKHSADRGTKPRPMVPMDPPASKPRGTISEESKACGLEQASAGAYRITYPSLALEGQNDDNRNSEADEPHSLLMTPSEANAGSDSKSSHVDDRQITARIVDSTTDDREATIQQLTQAVQSLQIQLASRQQEIPRAEVVETKCQCVIL